mmetsp:Transcript_5421/g.23057  ORF Transcript_5421/g.23057 Transcript_5421/m.23057 type:complete len:205 (-) Transcript_5421:1733-2347(-)
MSVSNTGKKYSTLALAPGSPTAIQNLVKSATPILSCPSQYLLKTDVTALGMSSSLCVFTSFIHSREAPTPSVRSFIATVESKPKSASTLSALRTNATPSYRPFSASKRALLRFPLRSSRMVKGLPLRELPHKAKHRHAEATCIANSSARRSWNIDARSCRNADTSFSIPLTRTPFSSSTRSTLYSLSSGSKPPSLALQYLENDS